MGSFCSLPFALSRTTSVNPASVPGSPRRRLSLRRASRSVRSQDSSFQPNRCRIICAFFFWIPSGSMGRQLEKRVSEQDTGARLALHSSRDMFRLPALSVSYLVCCMGLGNCFKKEGNCNHTEKEKCCVCGVAAFCRVACPPEEVYLQSLTS